jgi:hypothetical protein
MKAAGCQKLCCSFSASIGPACSSCEQRPDPLSSTRCLQSPQSLTSDKAGLANDKSGLQKQLAAVTANLGAVTANLTACQGNLGAINANLTACQGKLGQVSYLAVVQYRQLLLSFLYKRQKPCDLVCPKGTGVSSPQ